MGVNFDSNSFNELSRQEKKEIVKREFAKCSSDFQYYLDNYAYIRHPNAGIIPMHAFDFQLDVAIPISKVLLNRRSQASINELKQYKPKFDYEKWLNNLSTEMLDKIPTTFHNFHKITVNQPDYNTRVDTIILKSRQTGLSTIFQQLVSWHINFHPSVADLVLSKKDRDAKKFLKDIKTQWGLIPNVLRARRLAKNEHELWMSISGLDEHQSGVQVLPPTEDAGRSFSPNLIVLDEFAEYRHAQKIWTSISMSVSAGGIIVIIATPKGVGNLYHQMWEATNKSLSVTVDGLKNNSPDNLSVFRPVVVHWSQLPENEFQRRGFDSGVGWYDHMRGKLAIEGGEKMVAQELDLDFNASGDTISYDIIKTMEKTALETISKPKTLTKDIPGLTIYELPMENAEYIIGVDVAEGVGADSDSLHVLKLPVDNLSLPRIVAKFNSNIVSIKNFKEIVRKTGLFYNEAWLNIEKNNHGHVLLTYFIEDGDYNSNKILNTYTPSTNKFSKTSKGWLEQQATRNLLIQSVLDFVTDYQDKIPLPIGTVNEFKTFINNKGRWEAQPGYHDDDILSLGLTIIGWRLLDKYKQFLATMGQSEIASNIDEDDVAVSNLADIITNGHETNVNLYNEEKEKSKYISKEDFNKDKLLSNLLDDHTKIKESRPEYWHNNVSTVTDITDDDEIDVFGG